MNKNKCPNCGSNVIWYHNPDDLKMVCEQKCQEWKPIKTVDRKDMFKRTNRSLRKE